MATRLRYAIVVIGLVVVIAALWRAAPWRTPVGVGSSNTEVVRPTPGSGGPADDAPCWWDNDGGISVSCADKCGSDYPDGFPVAGELLGKPINICCKAGFNAGVEDNAVVCKKN